MGRNKNYLFMRKNLISIILALSLLMVNGVVFAQENNPTPTPTSTPTPTVTPTPTLSPSITPLVSPMPATIIPHIKNIGDNDLKQSLSINEIKGRFICKLVGGCDNLEKGEVEILIKAAQVTGVSGSYLGIKIFGIEYRVDLSKAKLLKYQWTETALDNFAPGDLVNVYGFLDANDPNLIHAQTVRNLSLQKHMTVLGGVIADLGNYSFSLVTEDNGSFNVLVTNDTKIIKTEGVACIQIYPPINCPVSSSTIVTFSDLKNGEKAIVRGELEKGTNQITAEQIIIGNDGRPFFNKELKIRNQQQNNGLKEEIKNQIRSLQERIKELRDQMKMMLF